MVNLDANDLDALDDGPDPDPPADEEPGWFGPDLDYAYDPGAGGDWMAS